MSTHSVILAGLAVLSLAAGAASPSSAAPEPEPIAATVQGQVAGRIEDGAVSYRNIPFAAPPVGDLRWRAPKPPAAWSGVRAYDETRVGCPQPASRFTVLDRMSEDCLYLNVFAPAERSAAKLPIMVWIHGGGFVRGAGASAMYDGDVLAQDGVVVVTINYRLGPLGFLAHPDLVREAKASGEATGNYGLMDQIAALSWVRDNIAAFGGDPEDVTIMGESAGGLSVRALMTSPKADGLFDKAVIMSGAGGWDTRGLDEALAQPAPAPFDEPIAALRAQSWEAVTQGFIDAFDRGERPELGPIVDGVVLPEDPGAAFAGGRQARAPLIVGATSNEGVLRRAFGLEASEVFALLGVDAAAARTLYDPERGLDDDNLADLYFGDAFLVEPARALARDHVAAGLAVYHYHFDYVPERFRRWLDGVPHGMELLFLFAQTDALSRRLQRLQTEDDRAASQRMIDHWTNFVRVGAPGSKWPAFAKGAEATFVFSETGERVILDHEAVKLDFWSANRARRPVVPGG